MTTEQNYLEGGTTPISRLSISDAKFEKISKRIEKRKPTLVSCQYKPEVLRKSIAKYNAYRSKMFVCILLVAKFYFDNVKKSRFNFDTRQKFSTTNLHGVFSGGFKLIERVDPHTKKPIKLKNALHNHYSDEVNFITGQFLILVEKASLHNGPALWRFRELDLGDIILVELYELVKKYGDELNRMVMLFKDARFEDETEVICEFIDWSDDENESVRDVNFVIDDVVRIWICGFCKY